MHGRPRTAPKALTPEQQAKLDNYIKHKTMLLAARKKELYTPATAALTAGLLKINPDFYTVFNFRKEIILHQIAEAPDRKDEILKEELETMTQALMQQPKSYYVWYHRVWVFDQGYTDYMSELANCAKFLTMDPRNFHCWRHRHHFASIALAKGLITLQDELNFTKEKIVENFSNYSAWHYRSVILLKIQSEAAIKAQAEAKRADADEIQSTPEAIASSSLATTTEDDQLDPAKHWEKLIREELALVASAIGMEPNDQSIWLYHRWLIAQIVAAPTHTPFEVPESTTGDAHDAPSGAEIDTRLKMQNPLSMLPTITLDHNTQSDASADGTAQNASSSVAAAFTLPTAVQLELLGQELAFLRDQMLVLEPNSRWILTSIAVLHAAQFTIQAKNTVDQAHLETQRQACKDQISEVFSKLATIDPFRAQYYVYVKSQILQQVSK